MPQRYTISSLNCAPSWEKKSTNNDTGSQKNHPRYSRKRRPRPLAPQAAVRPVQRSPILNERQEEAKENLSQDALWQYFMLIFLSFFSFSPPSHFLNSFGLDLVLLQGMVGSFD